MALIYLSLSDEASSIIRRISWAFESPIPKTLEAIVLKLPMIMDKEKVCRSCKDHSKCEGCPFHQKGGPVEPYKQDRNGDHGPGEP